MAEPIRISSEKYLKQGFVEVDGKVWSMKMPGAGTQLRFSQASRSCKRLSARIDLMDKRVDTMTEQELAEYDALCREFDESERIVFGTLSGMFKDSTPDNSEVSEWIDNTPMAVLTAIFEDLEAKVNGQKSNGGDDATGVAEAQGVQV